jgi:type I restriction enzyme M protein
MARTPTETRTTKTSTKDTTPPPSPRSFAGFSEVTSFLWSVADLLRGDYKQADYGKVILPLTVLRRLDCVLAKSKPKVLAKHAELKAAKQPDGTIERMLVRLTGVPFYNTSKLDFESLAGDPNNVGAHLTSYIKGFSPIAADVIEQFKLADHIAKLDESDLLFQVLQRFASVDLHPEKVPNHVMGSIFEELIRRFAEASNETAGEHFTPREVIRLMVDLLFIEDEEVLRTKRAVRTLFDPAAGTGGMLSVAEEYLRELNPDAELKVFGEELNSESYAVCKSDMMIKGQNPENIVRGNSFSEDGHVGSKFDYMLSNPPFGVDWKKVLKVVEDEHNDQGFAGRFGPGLPRINDGSFLFLEHLTLPR